MITLGWIFLLLGLIGIFLPVLPTTPLLLLTAYLFGRNSKRCDRWLKKQEFYEKYVVAYKRRGGLLLEQKVRILLCSNTLLLISGILVDHLHLRLFLVFLAICKLIFFIRMPTIKQEKEVRI